MTLKVMIVDDEPFAREGLVELVARDADLEVTAVCADGEAAIAAFREKHVDLMLLDVEMPGMNGLDVVKAIGPTNIPAVIFVTAFDRYAVRAFEAHAIEYLHKPFTDERFAHAISHAKQSLRDRKLAKLSERLIEMIGDVEGIASTTESASRQQIATRIGVKSGMRSYFVSVDDIDWIEGADYCSNIHALGRGHLIRETLSSLEGRLDSRVFCRIHRSAIVNINRIREIQTRDTNESYVILGSGARIRIARGRRANLEALLEAPR